MYSPDKLSIIPQNYIHTAAITNLLKYLYCHQPNETPDDEVFTRGRWTGPKSEQF